VNVNQETKVIGGGFAFLASGCGPILSSEQRARLSGLDPAAFYPLADLLEILSTAMKSDPKLVYATGRRWGAAVKDEIAKNGATEVKHAMRLLCDVYQQHHQGDVGQLVVDDDGATAVFLTNGGPYPSELITGAYGALCSSLGADDVTVEPTERADRFRISWAAAS
jgi:hypothetical protein